MSDVMEDKHRPTLLFLVDDGWRYEKQVIYRYLKERVPLRLLTHNQQTYDILHHEHDITLLPVYPIKRHPLYAPIMFFARELNTMLTQRHRADWYRQQSAAVRALHRIREWTGQAGLRRYNYCQALKWLYRGSSAYTEVITPHRILVYNPVFIDDKRILFEAQAAGLRIISWVYSWDNPLKDNEFPSNSDAYLVWNNETRDDMVKRHGIPHDRIHITGPAQMDFLLEEKERKRPAPSARRYILYPCASGKAVFVEQEIELILFIRELLDSIDNSVELVVRPYPFRLDLQHNPYARLETRTGIDVAYFGRIVDERLLIDENIEHERYAQIRDALCMINLGSTIGLEAAFTDTPILQLAFCDTVAPSPELALNGAFQHEHLKYLVDHRFPNIVNNREELKNGLRNIVNCNSEPYKPYSENLRRFVDPLNTNSYKQVLCDTLLRLAKAWESKHVS